MLSNKIAAKELAQVSEVSQLQQLDTTPWYRKKNLRRLYIALVPAALGVEMTSGYDGSVLNGLQAVQPWVDCSSLAQHTIIICLQLTVEQTDFDNPNGALLGVITAAFSIGAVFAIPIVPCMYTSNLSLNRPSHADAPRGQ